MQTTVVTETKQLDFFNCLSLLDTLIQHKLLKKDPTDCDRSRILVYRAASANCPKGWYSENVHTAARELAEDAKDQEFLLGELQKRGILFHAESLERR